MGATCPVVVRGMRFASQKEAAAYFGVGQSAVAQALRRCGHLETLGLPPGATRRGKQRPARPERTVLFGVEFESRMMASRELGVRRNTIREVALGTATAAKRELVYAALLRWQAKRAGQ